MKLDIDLKSVVIGAVLTGILLVAMGATHHPVASYGRYQLALTDDYAYIIDTERGQVWQKSVHTSASSKSEFTKRFFAPKR